MHQLMNRVAAEADTNEEFSHPFFKKVRDMVNAGDVDMLHKEKIPLKLLRLTDAAQDGFVLLNYPGNRAEAELMEENKLKCVDCDKVCCRCDIVSAELGIRINKHEERCDFNSDGKCNFVDGSQPTSFEAELESYKRQKDELLAFYNHYGLLVDFDMRNGYDDYEKIKR